MLGATAGGVSIRQIAAELGVSVGTVHEDVNAELLTVRDRTGSLTENYRDLEMMRMDATTTPPEPLISGWKRGGDHLWHAAGVSCASP